MIAIIMTDNLELDKCFRANLINFHFDNVKGMRFIMSIYTQLFMSI